MDNPFAWYDIEEYDSVDREIRAWEFLQFPAHIALGALGFFLSSGSLFLADSLFSMKVVTEKEKRMMEEVALESLSMSTGAGSGLFTVFQKPAYLKWLGSNQ
jgi:hypothetical protein